MKKVGSIESILVATLEVKENQFKKIQEKKLWKNYKKLKSTRSLCQFNPN